jgi:hypothetical protein
MRECPNFIALHPLDLHAAHLFVVEGGARVGRLQPVLMDTSYIREIARMDEPSQGMDRIRTRFSRGILFMPIM